MPGIGFSNSGLLHLWVITENSYGLDLLEYYYAYEENSNIVREGFSVDVWPKYPVYKP